MIERAGLKVDARLASFIEDEALPGTGLDAPAFWRGLADIYARFGTQNADLLHRRDVLQAQIDAWHDEHYRQPFNSEAYRAFLEEVGYLVPPPPPFVIAPGALDAEVAQLAGPQLVVPVLNGRFLLNAVNARWGSLYDALYGSDALGNVPLPGDYDPARGEKVVAFAKAFLDRVVPLASGPWANLAGSDPVLANPGQLVGRSVRGFLFRNHGLHIEVVIDSDHPIGRTDPAGIADVVLESALSTIVDLEDSVATVDAEDKVAAYSNLLGVMRGTLEATFQKNGRSVVRSLADDRAYQGVDGSTLTLPGRSLLLMRNVGHLTTTPAIHLPDGREAFEGILDGVVTSLIALHDLKGLGRFRNSRVGAIYIVKPKMHGPDEAAFANRLFDAVEDLLGIARHTIKIGVMDEERRTSANLAACIHAVKDRIMFINTGFLDRTGDEIHTSMRAGAMVRKAEMKESAWLRAYEDRNVRIGLACGFSGRAQIGKGMWAAPDRMADMLDQKRAHPAAGANTAWVPSPTAATLHALHYHEADVFARQGELAGEDAPALDALLTIPLGDTRSLVPEQIRAELDNNAQGILGYVVRWIDQGVGCSKVPDLSDVGLMEDRATLRISAQHIANWLHHGVCSALDVEQAFRRMARRVDDQNVADPGYRPMMPDLEGSLAFQAARALVFDGEKQPNGYTEPLLHLFRRRAKRALIA